ncbi:LysE family translocator [Siculibacillus lacustris]|uniref:LysE family translocator n=1 Tax=Siculibacillus lacustris TaxID=1549641 RepID=A0A4Q9VHA0_9HYPH|nr:LysE family translocator [Siculibacillus lacustris]TBW34493.1 LysE family translocator [Siculibacillus lacustris]
MTLLPYFAAASAGCLYVVSPGPAVLALIGIGAARGRAPAWWFLTGHLFGDTLWCTLAVLAMVGARVFDPLVFELVALACGLYLGRLGWRAVTTASARGADDLIGDHPWRRGVLFGLTNPKSYPVALSMFTALFTGQAESLTFSAMPGLLAAAFAGFLIGDMILVWSVGTSFMRRLYRLHAVWIVRVTGALFLAFATATLWDAVPKLWRRV